MTFLRKALAATAMTALLAGAALETPAFAQEDDKPFADAKTRKVEAITLDVHKRLQKAQEAMELKDYATANVQLAELLERKVNNYERAVVWQLKAQIAFEKDDSRGAIAAYEEILKYSASIPPALELGITYSLSQLWFVEEDYDAALRYAQRWENNVAPEFVGPNQLSFISQLHYSREEYPEALAYIYRAIESAQAVDTIEVRESWYQIALSGHFELEQWQKVKETLITLVVNWPKPTYWEQLAGIYGQLGEEEKSYSLSEAAYKQGFFEDKPLQLVNVAQIMIARQAPIKATWVLEKALGEEKVEKTARNYKTLGQAYMIAAEYDKAIEPLSKAAELEEDAGLWSQIAQVQVQLDRHSDAVKTFKTAIEAYREEKQSEDTKETIVALMTQRGASLIEIKQFSEATKQLKEARRLSRSARQRRIIGQWETYMKAEKAREDLLAEVGLSGD